MIILICLLGLIAAGLPIANGFIMEHMVTSAVKNMDQGKKRPGFHHRIKILDYDRGLYSTVITWQIQNQSRFSKNQLPLVVLVDQAKHGWFSIESRTSLEKNPWYADWVDARLNGKDPLDIQTRALVTGKITSKIHMDAFSFEDQGQTVQVQAMDAAISTDKELETLKAKGSWQGASLGQELKLGPVAFESNMHRLTDYIWEGKNTFSLEQLFIDGQNNESLDLKRIFLTSNTTATEDKTRMTMTTGLHADGVTINHTPLSAWNADLKLKQVNIQALEHVMAIYSNIFSKAAQTLERQGNDPSDYQIILKEQMTRNRSRILFALNKLLKKDLGVEVSNLDIELPQGKVTGSLDFTLKKDVNTSGLFMLVMKPEKLIACFSLDAKLKLPTIFANGKTWMTEPLIPGMITGLFIADLDRISSEIQIKKNKLFLNGNEVVLDM